MKKFVILFLFIYVIGFSFSSAQVLTSAVPACFNVSTTIRIGIRSNDVLTLQQFLKEKNYFSVNPTGYFGSITLASVKAFQSANNLIADGIVGPKTREAIKKLFCESTTVVPESSTASDQNTGNTSNNNENTQTTLPTIPVPEVVTPPEIVPSAPVIVEDKILDAGSISSLKVRTEGPSGTTSTAVLASGSVTAGARSGTERWFELTTNPEVYKVSETIVAPKFPQRSNNKFDYWFSGLIPDTMYYYRACASNESIGQKTCGDTASVRTNKAN